MSYTEIRRGLILAAFLIPVSVVSLAEPPSDPIVIQEESKPEQAEQQPDPEPTNIPPVAAAPPAIIEQNTPEQPTPDQPTSDDAQKYKEADLDAQVRMAEASEKLFKVAWFQFIATIGEIILLVGAVWAAVWAARAAGQAATAAVEANYRDRAWVTSVGVDTGTGEDITMEGTTYNKALMFIPRWKNSGRTPAINLEIFRTFEVVAIDGEVPSFDHGLYDAETSKAVIGPGVYGTARTIAIVGQDFTDVLNRKAKVIVYSSARYNDVFVEDTLRLTEVCFEIVFNGEEKTADGNMARRFDIIPVGPQNKAE